MCTGHYFLDVNASLTISKSDLNASSYDNKCNFWTFNAIVGQRVMFKFHEFGLYWSSNFVSALEIGDGLEPGEPSRLAHFKGT